MFSKKITHKVEPRLVDGIISHHSTKVRRGIRIRRLTHEEIKFFRKLVFAKRANLALIFVSVLIVVSAFGGGYFTKQGSIQQKVENDYVTLEKPEVKAEPSVKGKTTSTAKIETSNWFFDANRIEIPTIKLIARVTYPKTTEETEEMLKSSVVHVFDSGLPGQGRPIIVSGHSSYKTAVDYDDVFAGITKIGIGDDIYLIKDGQKYHYKMTSYAKVPSDDRSLYTLEGERLILVTCWPVGTNLMRYAVIAKKVD